MSYDFDGARQRGDGRSAVQARSKAEGAESGCPRGSGSAQNRLIVRTKADGSTINLSYDADGNRTAKNLLDANSAPVSSTTYLVDTNNLTGYAQVAEERRSVTSGVTLKVYTYGNQLLSQSVSLNSQPSTISPSTATATSAN